MNQHGDESTFKNMKAIMDGGTEFDKLNSVNSKSNQAFGGLQMFRQKKKSYESKQQETFIKQLNRSLKKQLIIRHLNENRIYWDFFIILLAIYNSLALPMEIAFKPPWLMTGFNYSLNTLIDCLFGIDILITFRTTYVCPSTGAEVITGMEIAKNYLSGRFMIDLLSTIPFEKIAASDENLGNNYAIISCLKLIRVLRLQKLITHSNTSEAFKIKLMLFKMCFFLFLYIHITCCAWKFVNDETGNIWIPR
jgi:potassium channel